MSTATVTTRARSASTAGLPAPSRPTRHAEPVTQRLRRVPNGNAADGGPDPLLDGPEDRLSRLLALLEDAQRQSPRR